MRKAIITLFSTLMLFSCGGQTNQNNVMANTAQSSDILFQKQFQKQNKLFLRKDNKAKYYLMYVTIKKPVNYYPELDSVEFSKVEFTLTYVIESKSRNSRLYTSYIAYFAKDSDNVNYKIFEQSYLTYALVRYSIISRFIEKFLDIDPPEFSFIGYSDNEELLTVKVWNYVKEHFDYENIVWKKEE